MKSEEEIIESLIARGLIGAGIVALMSNGKDDVAIGSIISAAILGTYKANQKAEDTRVTRVFEEDGALYEVDSQGTKTFIKALEKPQIYLSQNFKLK